MRPLHKEKSRAVAQLERFVAGHGLGNVVRFQLALKLS